MNSTSEWKKLVALLAAFIACFFLPVGVPRFDNAVTEALQLVRWYAREHMVLCLVPAFFIAGAIGVFVSQASVMKYLGAGANKAVAYAVGSVSGTILAVCSCTVLPLFAGIWRMGAGLGPATAFLYSGPAINVLAIVLTARVLGMELGLARAVGAVVFSVVIGLLMHGLFRKQELSRAQAASLSPDAEPRRPLWQNLVYFGCMVGILVFANWGKPVEPRGLWHGLWLVQWPVTAALGVGLGVTLVRWFGASAWKALVVGILTTGLAVVFPGKPMVPFLSGAIGVTLIAGSGPRKTRDWVSSTWTFAKQITPLLLLGVLAAGFLLGRPGHEGIIPSHWVTKAVGGNSLQANLFASVVGAFMYFATLTEVPILRGLIDNGMGKGPALALLLAGPALSLQSMLVLRSVMGLRRTVVYVVLVITMATISGMLFGSFVP